MSLDLADFNPKIPSIMHIDINSCFATIEQQANPFLRGHPIVVAAYTAGSSCILAASREAKVLGIKTGMMVKDAIHIYPKLKILSPDTEKYRFVHIKMRDVLNNYTSDVRPKSIDEFSLNFEGTKYANKSLLGVAKQIKQQIKNDIGEFISVSIGIGPNYFLAKTAAGLKKPDGLEEINKDNFLNIYKGLKLTDLCGIAKQNNLRLGAYKIFSTLDFYNAHISTLTRAFHSISGYYWFLRLRGYEIDGVEFKRKSFGNSYAIPQNLTTPNELSPILYKLVEKMSARLRRANLRAKGLRIFVDYKNGQYWHMDRQLKTYLYDLRDFYKESFKLLNKMPVGAPVRVLAVACFNTISEDCIQLDLFLDVEKNTRLVKAVDKINANMELLY